MTDKFDFRQFCKDNPGIENWNPTGRRKILSTPVACVNGDECYIKHYDIIFDNSIYRCPQCNRKYVYRIYKWEIGKKDRSGWYLQNDNIFDIIKSLFTRDV